VKLAVETPTVGRSDTRHGLRRVSFRAALLCRSGSEYLEVDGRAGVGHRLIVFDVVPLGDLSGVAQRVGRRL
jgi:hypothetical protein